MGMRFRKSVKICKGVKVNFSKSGASLSLGGKGHSVNVGSRGTRITAGIPGTGLSYSAKIGGKSHSKSKSSSHSSTSRPTVQMPNEVGIKMNDKGKIVILNAHGEPITDQAVLRRIKATAQYQAQVVALDAQRREMIDEMVRDSEAENERFINIYKLSSIVDCLADFQTRLKGLKPAKYEITEYDVPAPTEASIRESLVKEAETEVKGSFFKIGKLRKQYVEENLQSRLNEALSAWANDRDEFKAIQMEELLAFDKAAHEECEAQKAFLQGVIEGEYNAVCEVFDSWIASCELPVEMNVAYDWNSESGVMMLDVDLPEIEHIAPTKYIKTDTGNIKEKKKTQAELREEYSTLVFGLAIFLSSNAFNVSPAITKLLISGYTQRRDKEGNINDDYVYSIKFSREMFEERDLTSVSPKDFCLASTENRCNMTSTALFKKIVPFDTF